MLKRNWHLLVAVLVCSCLLGINYLSGAFSVTELPNGYTSKLELLGQVIMFSLLAPYLLLGVTYGRRYSLQLAADMDAEFTKQVSQLPWAVLGAGTLIGSLNGMLFNLSPAQVAGVMELSPIHTSVVASNIFTWSVVGFTLTLRLTIAWRFHKFGQQVTIDLFNIVSLKPFARNGLADVLLISGAIALTVFQALDATFRLDNFANALVVAAPALVILFLLPSYSTHKRIGTAKEQQLASVQTLIDEAPRSLEVDDMNRLEVLLQRRERLTSVPTWPIDLSMLYRLFLYGVIPPIAWVAAALVEIYLESTLVG